MREEPKDLWVYEREAFAKGYQAVCGVDEAGRGPLTGPVCAAAVILPAGLVIDGLNDSKKLSEKKREALYDVIRQEALAYCVASASEAEIDGLNILGATFLAMHRAVEGLSQVPELVLVDGNQDPRLGLSTETVIKGDGQSQAIAAASILAKVSRDRYMLELDQQYPEYDFKKHKGYPTKEHYERLTEYGISPVHRRSFLKKFTGGQS